MRAQILDALGGVRDAKSAPPVLSFSELRAAVESDIDSSQFNYHLQQLVGRYVRRTDGGYQMRPVGMLLYRTIRAGTVTDELCVAAFETGIDCYRCGGSILADPDFGEFWLQCAECEHFYDMVMAPPATVNEGNTDELLTRLDQYNRHRRLAFRRGICPVCMHRVDQRITTVDEEPYTNTELVDRHVHWSCGHCGHRMFASRGMALADTPTVLSFFESRGVDLTERTVWEFEFAMTDRTLTVHSTDPMEFSLDISHEDAALELLVDEHLSILETRG